MAARIAVPVLFREIKLQNFLSFLDSTLELRSLNVLIGPNGAGKSNLIDAVALLHAAPANLPETVVQMGGVRTLLTLVGGGPSATGRIECEIQLGKRLHYSLEIGEMPEGFTILNESLSAVGSDPAIYVERSYESMQIRGSDGKSRIPHNQSALAAYRNPGDPTPITEVGRKFEQIRIYREFRTSGFLSSARSGVSSSVTGRFLQDGGDNLAVVLQELDFKGVHSMIQSYLSQFCDRYEDVKIRLNGPIAQTYLQESSLSEPLSAMRISDGTLKFLCLLAVLLNPDIPPLICIEEPEVGLHPDAIRIVAQALVEASERTQLIVTTHSEALIDALSERPEDVLVCERDFDNGTQFRRLNKERLSGWLERYTLGALWRNGELGGNRW